MAIQFPASITLTGRDQSLSATFQRVGDAGEASGERINASYSKTKRGLDSISTTLNRTRQQFMLFVGAQQLLQVGRGMARMADEQKQGQVQLSQETWGKGQSVLSTGSFWSQAVDQRLNPQLLLL